MLSYLLVFLFVVDCLFLLVVILLQQGKGGDIANAFGGGSSQTAFGARGGATLLSKLTAVFAAIFMVTALALGIVGQRGPSSSLMRGTPAPAAPAQSTPAAPATPEGGTPAAPATPSGTPATPPAEGTATPAPATGTPPATPPK